MAGVSQRDGRSFLTRGGLTYWPDGNVNGNLPQRTVQSEGADQPGNVVRVQPRAVVRG